jgi:1,2-diacylglycerol 3-alpha-glucosyltransferase
VAAGGHRLLHHPGTDCPERQVARGVRIAIVSQTFVPGHSGQGVFAVSLADGLAARGHRVLAVRPGRGAARHGLRRGPVRVAEVAALPLARDPSAALTIFAERRVGRLLDDFAPDVVHLQDHYPLSAAALAHTRRRGIPTVATNHFLPRNMLAFLPVPERLDPLAQRAMWAWLRRVFNGVALSTAPSKRAVELLREHGVATTTDAISCGVDVNRFRPASDDERNATRLRYGLDPGRPLLTYVGRLDPEKRLDVLLDALAGLARRNHAWQLLLVGRGHQAGALARRAQSLAIDDAVHFAGYLPRADLPPVVAAADIFVIASDAELLSIATLEAMASGLPIVAADAVALPELVQAGINGRLFRPGDAADLADQLQATLEEHTRWAEMGAASRALAERHDRRLTIDRYEALYRRAVGAAQSAT